METKTPYKSFRYKPAQLGTPPDEVRFLGRENRASMLAVRLSLKASLTSGHLKSYGSVNTCMMLTFLTLAQAKGLTPVRYESEAEGLLENIEGKYRITEVMVRPRVGLKDKAELERAREIMESVEAQCFISNSIKSKVLLAAEFVVAPRQSENE
jgi:hypothetical protein